MTQSHALPVLFKRRHLNREILSLCGRGYLSYKLSSRDVVAIMAKRNVDVAHPTILRWVQRYVPAFEKRWQRYARPIGTSWSVDETYLKGRGKWGYCIAPSTAEGQQSTAS